MKNDYYIVTCDAGTEVKVNPGYQHYFRLYRKNDKGVSILVEQGLGNKLEYWEKRFGVVYNIEDDVNPYPELD